MKNCDALRAPSDTSFRAHSPPQRPDGSDIRAFLLSETGQRTVPNIFIKEKHIGGCDGMLCFPLA